MLGRILLFMGRDSISWAAMAIHSLLECGEGGFPEGVGWNTDAGRTFMGTAELGNGSEEPTAR